MAYNPVALKRVPNTPFWTYETTDAITNVRAANYIHDAKSRRMAAGHWLFVTVKSGATVIGMQVMPVMSVSTTGADLADGTAISVTNT